MRGGGQVALCQFFSVILSNIMLMIIFMSVLNSIAKILNISNLIDLIGVNLELSSLSQKTTIKKKVDFKVALNWVKIRQQNIPNYIKFHNNLS